MRLIYVLATWFAIIIISSLCENTTESSEEKVYEPAPEHETTADSAKNVSKQIDPTENHIEATPEYKYRQVMILAQQLYWTQLDHVTLTRIKHQRWYVAKELVIPKLNDFLNDTRMYIKKKCAEIEEIYSKVYAENITWADRMTKIPIEQETIDELARRWKKVLQMFDKENRKEKAKNLPPTEIESIRSSITLVQEELEIQYETLKERMREVLKIIDELKIPVTHGVVTKKDDSNGRSRNRSTRSRNRSTRSRNKNTSSTEPTKL